MYSFCIKQHKVAVRSLNLPELTLQELQLEYLYCAHCDVAAETIHMN